VKVLFATAEFSPLVSVGGLAEASAGLVHALRDAGLEVEVVLPDYRAWELEDESVLSLDVPSWASPAVARSGLVDGVGRVTLIEVPGIERPNPYVDESGSGWPDNPDRFFAFSAAVAALATLREPDLVHCNDWHTAAVPGFLDAPVPIVLTIHTLGYQGWTSGGWLDRIPHRPDLFGWHGGTSPLAGGIQLADAVVAVSPTYAQEILRPETGSGLDGVLRDLGDRLVGIRNGIDTSIWNPGEDPLIPHRYTVNRIEDKDACRLDLIESVGWQVANIPTVGIVSRLVEQKGIDIALDAITYADHIPFRMVLVGSGEQWIADRARSVSADHPDRLWFFDGYNIPLAHRVFAGSDLVLMPSRFEPCGLAQMQAMEYGAIPVVTSVGGLVDTVLDADEDRKQGTGFVSATVDVAGIVDALHRATRAWKSPRRREAIQVRGMTEDWSWRKPAQQYIDVYEEAVRRKS